MKIGIVGYGWLGLPLAESLRLLKHDLIGTSTSQSKIDWLNSIGYKAIYFYGNTTEELKSALKDADWIVITIPPSSKAEYVQIISGLINAFPPACKVIFTSSISVYCEINGLVNEQSELNEEHVVVKAERLLLERLGDRLTILRLGGLIGNDRHPVKYLAGKTGLAGGRNPVNLVHLEDVINAIKVSIRDQHFGQIFNIVSPEHPSKKEYYSMKARQYGLELPQFTDDERTGKIVTAKYITTVTKFDYSKSIL